jgi:hypothetical protein
MSSWSIVRHQVAIAGKVLENATGKPMSSVQVSIVGMPAEAERAFQLKFRYADRDPDGKRVNPAVTLSRSDGLFWFVDLPQGDYQLRAEIPNQNSRYGKAEQKVVVKWDADGTIQKGMARMVLPSTTLRGKVSGANHPNGLAMAEVRVAGSGESGFTDPLGQYLLKGIESGNRKIIVTALGYKTLADVVHLDGPGTLNERDFELQAGSRGQPSAVAAVRAQKQEKKGAGKQNG